MSALALGVVLGQLAHLSPAGYAGTLSLGDRSEARVHSNINAPNGVDFDTTPFVGARLRGRSTSYEVGYGVRFGWVDVNTDAQFITQHNGKLSFGFGTKRTRWTLSLNGSIGRQNAAGLGLSIPLAGAPAPEPAAGTAPGATPNPSGSPAPQPPPMGAQPPTGAQAPPAGAAVYYLPASFVLYTGSFRGSLSVSNTFSRDWVGAATAYYQMSGGFDFFSQRLYEPSRGGGGDLSATYAVSKTDHLVSHLFSEYTYTLRSTDHFFVVTFIESLRHDFSKRTQGAVGAGVSTVVRKLARQRALSGAVTGAGEASITHVAPMRDHATLTTRAGANLGQAYNPFLATVQFLGSASGSAAWAREPFTVSASVSAATSLPVTDSDPSRTVSGGLAFGYALADPVTLQTGVRTYAQLFPSHAEVTYPPQWVAFVAVLLVAPPEKF